MIVGWLRTRPVGQIRNATDAAHPRKLMIEHVPRRSQYERNSPGDLRSRRTPCRAEGRFDFETVASATNETPMPPKEPDTRRCSVCNPANVSETCLKRPTRTLTLD